MYLALSWLVWEDKKQLRFKCWHFCTCDSFLRRVIEYDNDVGNFLVHDRVLINSDFFIHLPPWHNMVGWHHLSLIMFCLPALMEIALNSLNPAFTHEVSFLLQNSFSPLVVWHKNKYSPLLPKWKGSKTETSKLIYSRTHLTGNWLKFDVITPETINGCNREKAYSVQG